MLLQTALAIVGLWL